MSPRCLRHDEDGTPVYERVAIGGESPELTCSCGRTFVGKVTGVMFGGEGWPSVALCDCECGSTRGFQIEEARAA